MDYATFILQAFTVGLLARLVWITRDSRRVVKRDETIEQAKVGLRKELLNELQSNPERTQRIARYLSTHPELRSFRKAAIAVDAEIAEEKQKVM